MIKKIIEPLQLFLLLWVLWLSAGIVLYFIYPKGVLELKWNENHNLLFDYFFTFTTYLGNGFVYAIFVVTLLFIDRRKFLIGLTASLTCMLISVLMKQYFFRGEERPLTYFGDTVNIHLPDGAEKLLFGSFPSGHTLSAFSMFLLAAYFMKNKIAQFSFFCLAVIVGLSRIYLMAHFKEDVWTGSLLGVLISFSAVFIFQFYFPKQTENKPLIRLKR